MKPDKSQDTWWTWLQMTRGPKRQRASLQSQPENSEACIARIQALTVKETTSKSHMQVHTNKGSREKEPGRKPRPNRVEMGLGRPAWADRPSPPGVSSVPPLS
jgi:hypothetical protein